MPLASLRRYDYGNSSTALEAEPARSEGEEPVRPEVEEPVRSEGEEPVRSEGERAPTIDELFRQHAPAIASLGMSMLGRQDEADDLVQDVFIRALKGLDGLRDYSRVRPWLITIAVRAARTRLQRRRLSRLVLPKEEVDYESLAATDCSPEDKVQIAKLFGILDNLNAAQRIAWILRYMQAETIEAVARYCGCSATTAKRRVKQANSAIQKGMK